MAAPDVARRDMTHRPPVLLLVAVLALVAILAALAGLVALPAAGAAAKPAKKTKATTFEACRAGCRYRSIQKAVDAAGGYAYKNPKAKVIVAIRPGKYVEGVVLDGIERRERFDGMTIEGTKPDRTRTVLEGRSAGGELAAARNGIEAIGVDGLVIRNIWARNFESATRWTTCSPPGTAPRASPREDASAAR
jgi:pectin methylesterase-like acyl-CoA thioesterase